MINKQGSVITIGTFDGVHKGHQAILNKVVKIAKKENLTSVVFSFDLPIKHCEGLITSSEEKINLISSFGVDKIVLLPLNKEIISTTAQDFFNKVLVDKFNVKHVVVGYDCAFGKDRQGNIAWLKKITKQYNIKLDVINPIKVSNKIVSSSKIRKYILSNNINFVNKMLNRLFEFTGIHVSGNKIGRTIGFPTINLQIDKNILIPKGVFSCIVVGNNNILYRGMLNIGYRPTIDLEKKQLSVEIHLLNFSGVWKQKKVKVLVCKFLRKEKQFKNIESLQKAIKKDIENL